MILFYFHKNLDEKWLYCWQENLSEYFLVLIRSFLCIITWYKLISAKFTLLFGTVRKLWWKFVTSINLNSSFSVLFLYKCKKSLWIFFLDLKIGEKPWSKKPLTANPCAVNCLDIPVSYYLTLHYWFRKGKINLL